mmetsp:Transcript_120640/g.303298  ORF Transcript_120640/g.303298 Transcript_120640/m.303298 type:complete len:1307 (-) Transcript_120640:181-4101(-)
MGAGAGKRIDEGNRNANQLRTVATAATVVTVLPKKKAETIPEAYVDNTPRSEGSDEVLGGAQRMDPTVVSAAHQPSANLWADRPHSDGYGPSTQGVQVKSANSSSKGDFKVGQSVRLNGLEKAAHLNGQQAVIVEWEADSGRWTIRLQNGSEKRVRSENMQVITVTGASSGSGSGHRGGAGVIAGAAARAPLVASADLGGDANKELEALLLQSNWAAIYQLFHQRFGVAALDQLERGYVVKSAVEMTLSIVAKCFALLRSDPSGRLHCTPLHIAALQSSTEAAEVIVRDLPQVVLQTHVPSHTALCPLHIAILCGAQPIVELLLEGKADANVRTLHDVCPIHLAATISKDLCQLLLAYGAEPQLRDVMGSTAIHYAAAFKHHLGMEFLLSTPKGVRLAGDVDQKRVTPLHISCALYTTEDDLAAPMVLMAHGAKPWQADCHGAPPREMVPWVRNNKLLQFFEAHGDRAQGAAQQWMEEQYLSQQGGEGAGGDAAVVSDDENDDTPQQTPRSKGVSKQGAVSEQIFQAKSSVRHSRAFVGDQSAALERSAELAAEVERLRAELSSARQTCADLEKDKAELEHLRAKCSMLEQSTQNQQKVFDGLQALYESERVQHQQQVEALQVRHAADKADLAARTSTQVESTRSEERQELMRQMELERGEFNMRLQAVQVELDDAKAAVTAAQAEQAAAAAEAKLGATICGGGAPATSVVDGETAARLLFLEEEVQRLVPMEEQARASADQQRVQLNELRVAITNLCMRHSIGIRGETPGDLLEPLDAELQRLKATDAGTKSEVQALQEKLTQQHEELASLNYAKLKADDQVKQLCLKCQELENRSSANALKLETKLQDIELQHSQALTQLRSEADLQRQRAEEAQEQSRQLQPTIDRLGTQLQTMEVQFAEEQALRKKYHNQIQDMKGAIRVFCRFRPLVSREAGEAISLRRVDAFTAELMRPVPQKDTKSFQFDAVFDGDSTQEDVFADCRDLVQSAVDGYNVTIFAYGQTGAGKTHTMYGNPQQPGLAPRSIQALFDVIRREEQRGKKFKVKTYMIEVYKQDILDLLIDKPPPKDRKGGLEVKKDLGRGMMYVDGVTEKVIKSPEELMATLTEGEKKRHVTATKMNSASSRSHLLLSIIIECVVKETEQVLFGKITLCDLAGSERPKKSEVSGEGLKEAIEINKSLSALGDVIEALTKGNKSIPYRNHKLTTLMQDSLGGSAKTLMFVNCSPAGSNAEETQMSLKWATRARQVTNDVKRNADSKEVARLKQVIAMMSQAQSAEAAPDEQPAEPAEMPPMDMQMAMNATMRGR